MKLKKVTDGEPLAYTHEHIVPAYILIDIKAEYVLLEKTFSAKLQLVSITF
jgi:hypothetical protein